MDTGTNLMNIRFFTKENGVMKRTQIEILNIENINDNNKNAIKSISKKADLKK